MDEELNFIIDSTEEAMQGAITHLVASSVDITERVRAQRDLAAEELQRSIREGREELRRAGEDLRRIDPAPPDPDRQPDDRD